MGPISPYPKSIVQYEYKNGHRLDSQINRNIQILLYSIALVQENIVQYCTSRNYERMIRDLPGSENDGITYPQLAVKRATFY